MIALEKAQLFSAKHIRNLTHPILTVKRIESQHLKHSLHYVQRTQLKSSGDCSDLTSRIRFTSQVNLFSVIGSFLLISVFGSNNQLYNDLLHA